MPDCGHLLCELTGERGCSLAVARSRGCRPNTARTIAPAIVDEVRALLAIIESRDDRVRTAAVRLAEIVRRAALDDRPLLAYARTDEPELVPALERLCVRRN